MKTIRIKTKDNSYLISQHGGYQYYHINHWFKSQDPKLHLIKDQSCQSYHNILSLRILLWVKIDTQCIFINIHECRKTTHADPDNKRNGTAILQAEQMSEQHREGDLIMMKVLMFHKDIITLNIYAPYKQH